VLASGPARRPLSGALPIEPKPGRILLSHVSRKSAAVRPSVRPPRIARSRSVAADEIVENLPLRLCGRRNGSLVGGGGDAVENSHDLASLQTVGKTDGPHDNRQSSAHAIPRR
jgi:hypothetical protein